MIKNIKNRYDDCTVRLDNNEFIECEFNRCRLEFAGEGPVSLIRCKFSNVSWHLVGPAQNTIHFLRGIYHGMGDAGHKLVESIFDNIRAP
jgi:hypothetical protein